MTKLELTKTVAKTVVGIGTGMIIRAIVANNVQGEDLPAKVAITAGSFVLGSMVADVATRYTDASIDKAAEWYNDNIKK